MTSGIVRVTLLVLTIPNIDPTTITEALSPTSLVTKTRALIETTRRELLQLRDEIEWACNTIDRTQSLLSRTEPSMRRIASLRREARAGQ